MKILKAVAFILKSCFALIGITLAWAGYNLLKSNFLVQLWSPSILHAIRHFLDYCFPTWSDLFGRGQSGISLPSHAQMLRHDFTLSQPSLADWMPPNGNIFQRFRSLPSSLDPFSLRTSRQLSLLWDAYGTDKRLFELARAPEIPIPNLSNWNNEMSSGSIYHDCTSAPQIRHHFKLFSNENLARLGQSSSNELFEAGWSINSPSTSSIILDRSNTRSANTFTHLSPEASETFQLTWTGEGWSSLSQLAAKMVEIDVADGVVWTLASQTNLVDMAVKMSQAIR